MYFPCFGLGAVQTPRVLAELIVVPARGVVDMPIFVRSRRMLDTPMVVRPRREFVEPAVLARCMLSVCYGYTALGVCLCIRLPSFRCIRDGNLRVYVRVDLDAGLANLLSETKLGT